MAIKYINILQSKALQNLPKLGFLVWKQTVCNTDLKSDPKMFSTGISAQAFFLNNLPTLLLGGIFETFSKSRVARFF
jgi:hypothetical protein